MCIYRNTFSHIDIHAIKNGEEQPWIWQRVGNGIWEGLERKKGLKISNYNIIIN